ncbi:MAG: hypothetical protein CR997_13635 [Acidobacteria bacterium]|nr:MAG: hypothetical protein CR997_13635 [Acidobacteriota bacterium]
MLDNVMEKIDLIQSALGKGKKGLSEEESRQLLSGLSVRVPESQFISKDKWESFTQTTIPSSRVVLKIVSPVIQHKTEWGGVRVLENKTPNILQAMKAMADRIGELEWNGFTLNEFIDYNRSLGHELLLGFRMTPDFGPVVVLGPGGIHTEYIAKTLSGGRLLSVFSKALHTHAASVKAELIRNDFLTLVTGGLRGQAAELSLDTLAQVILDMLELGEQLHGKGLDELEINPLVVYQNQLVVLDALAGLAPPRQEETAARPIHKIDNLLKPSTIGLIGVSQKMNPGRIILKNTLASGFQPENITIIKPGAEQIDGCRCVPAISDMEKPVDLMVLSVSANQVPGIMNDIIETENAESVILIPGGFEEKFGSREIVNTMRDNLAESRKTKWQGPVINGGNCVGVRSVPGLYDSIFIPQHKLKQAADQPDSVAIISQSGAYLVSMLDRLQGVSPQYAVSIGNQTDLTLADYVAFLKDHTDVRVFGIYCEGLKPGDGRRLLKLSTELKEEGRNIVFYSGGKTKEGARATASHTASVAGDYQVLESLFSQCGVLLAEALDDFEDLIELSTFLNAYEKKGLSCGALSNAGFECVAIADNLGLFKLSQYTEAQNAMLLEVLQEARVDHIVDLHNPLDLTPMMTDRGFGKVLEVVLDGEDVDLGVFGIVPVTPALNTLQKNDGHKEDLESKHSIVQLLLELKEKADKPWIVVVDSGQTYNPMVDKLKSAKIPTFRKMDRAMRLLGQYYRAVYQER